MGHATPGATPPVPPARIPASNNGPAKGNTPMSSPYSSTQAAALACRAFCARISRLLDILVSIPVTVLLVSLVAIVGYSVITRYIFSNPPAWTEEVSLFMIVATVFICLRVTFKRGQQIGVTILVDKSVLFFHIERSGKQNILIEKFSRFIFIHTVIRIFYYPALRCRT